MQIDILHVPGCPNLEHARARLREAVRVAGVDAATREIEVATPDAASRAGMRGSPTILIDGRDPFVAGGEPASVSCRVYATPAGADGAPTVEQLVRAMAGRGA